MRQGREIYSDKYEIAIKLYKEGIDIPEIAKRLGISYSAAYHWVKGIRKPDTGNIKEFELFLKDNGPANAADVKSRFPKHNEIFLTAKKRGIIIGRYEMKNKKFFGESATWYFLKGQEDELKARIKQMIKEWKLRKVREVMGDV
ncbi:MAG: helix-turn-helix domain-containing protein [Candidatus Aenigmarchaeota archaeon]|nr:helix-turn-helix domain-containing protein [Candidatus Aenigmarchaeota archaeon]